MASSIEFGGRSSEGDSRSLDLRFVDKPVNLAGLGSQNDEDYARSLSTLIESEIIPRLMVSHATALPAAIPSDRETLISEKEIAAFGPLVMEIEADALLVHVESIITRGVAVDSVLINLLAPTARLLGEFWEDGRCDFVDVTMGLWRLQEVVQEISARLPAAAPPVAEGRRALFAPIPGDRPSFGTSAIDEIFQREGWLTDRLGYVETTELLRRAADNWFDIIALTVSSECHIAALPSIIAALRNVSKNPRVCVMLGGRVFSADPGLAVDVGADATARDAKLAPKVAGELVRERVWGAASCS